MCKILRKGGGAGDNGSLATRREPRRVAGASERPRELLVSGKEGHARLGMWKCILCSFLLILFDLFVSFYWVLCMCLLFVISFVTIAINSIKNYKIIIVRNSMIMEIILIIIITIKVIIINFLTIAIITVIIIKS